ncbi:hypothetical protein EDB85DRAFT_1899983 [Lactarius pseudohatsudake]|nr:hypothetical protein EDB85DRAFT_1899983 [Lactarius pseudohatsudake]
MSELMLHFPEESGMDAAPSSENHDFGMDDPLQPPTLHSTRISPAPLHGTGGDDDFGMDDPMPPDAARKDEEFRMNIPLPSDPQGRVWSWGNRAPPPRDTGPSLQLPDTPELQQDRERDREYRAQAASLRAEANRIWQLYSELRRVYGGESELTDTVEEMVVELELDKYQVQAGSHRRHRRNIITSPTLPQCYNTDTAPQGHDTDMMPPGYNINTALWCGSDTDTVPRGYDGAAASTIPTGNSHGNEVANGVPDNADASAFTLGCIGKDKTGGSGFEPANILVRGLPLPDRYTI